MFTCQQLTELVTDYLEGRLSFRERMSFQMHLGMCSRCRAYLRQMRATITMLGKLPDEPIPAGVHEELLARFRAMQPTVGAVATKHQSKISILEGWLGPRGWIIVATILLGAALLGVALGGESGPLLGPWWKCLVVELVGAALPITATGVAAFRMRQTISAGSLAAIGASGALLGFLLLQLTCPYSRVTPHMLVVDVGGILIAALLGAAVSRLPMPRLPISGDGM